jgi:hypothetical protein
MDALLQYQLSTEQRLSLLWAFITVGLVICVQVAQTQTDAPWDWARLTAQTRPFWFTVYVLEAWLLVQNTYPQLLETMESLAIGDEERILNAVWIGLLGLEVLMVLGVAVQSIVKRLVPQPKQKAQ